ncbi:MAG: DUF2259 domain-containing protein [Treponemataceae bacterium]|nr:DUF2259 domain-containing protein [Treponemataceae bacterium]
MKRVLFLVFSFCFFCGTLFAGDVAVFDDIGFSADGKTYLFGQYGTTDKTFCGYAEIYAVDIESNSFKTNGIYRTNATEATAGKSGASIYDSLKKKNAAWLDSWKSTPAELSEVLYIRPYNTKAAEDEVLVRDFEHSSSANTIQYSFKLMPYKEGTGASIYSSFYITVEKRDSAGKLLGKTVAGSPDVKRRGISGYAIEKIMCDKTGTKFVIVIEKISEEENAAPSVRYMVETFVLK